MSKRKYRAVNVKSLDRDELHEIVRGQRVVFGIDVAKSMQFGALTIGRDECVVIVKWDLVETRKVLARLEALPARSVEIVLEPSGRYGDPLRHAFAAAGYSVYRVSPKVAHDSVEMFDGVPSSHDGKSAALLAWLHWVDRSKPWPIADEPTRQLKAKLDELDYAQDAWERTLNRLEGQLARYWPELSRRLKLRSATLLRLIAEYGSPDRVASAGDEAAELMRKIGGPSLRETKITQVLASSRCTLGVPPTRAEREIFQALASEADRLRASIRELRREIEAIASTTEVTRTLGSVLGPVTATVVMVYGQDPRSFSSAGAYLKFLGLNLKERSSGTRKGQLAITKRGSGRVRKWLFMAVLRLLQEDRLVRSWYERKVARDGGKKLKAIIAVLRKLVRALWSMAQTGQPFDSRKLFDARRLATSE